MGCRETPRCYTAAITFAPSSQRTRVGGLTMQQVTVRVPASTSNLGPGYDCLGVALRLHNSVTVVRGNTPRSSHPRIVSDAAERFFKQTRRRAFSFSYSIVEEVPRCRGLGSSATVRLGVLLGLNGLSGGPLDQLSLFKLCAELEGHPDNAAPATFGGFTVTRSDGFPAVMFRRLPKPSLLVVQFSDHNKFSRYVFRSNGAKSSSFSPVPTKRVGIPSSSWIATTMPPLPLPSSLVTIRPVSPSAL
jgi:hypothetical protein